LPNNRRLVTENVGRQYRLGNVDRHLVRQLHGGHLGRIEVDVLGRVRGLVTAAS
jgi:hypothetical protein